MDLYGDPLPPGAVARLGTVRLRHAGAKVVFSKDGSQLISCDRDGEIRIWDVASGKLVWRQQLPGKPRKDKRFVAVSLSPGGTMAATWDGETVYLYDTSTGRERGRIPCLGTALLHQLMKFSTDGKFLMLQMCSSARKYVTQIWNVETIQLHQTLATPPEIQLSNVVFTSDGKRLAGIAEIRDNPRNVRRFAF